MGNSFADRFRHVLDELDIGQEEMAERLGVKKGAVARWLTTGKEARSPRADSLTLWEDQTGYTLSWLLNGKGPEKVGEGNVTQLGIETDEWRHSGEDSLIQMLGRQQDLLIKQQAMMADQQAIVSRQQDLLASQSQDVSRLTELLARQQEFQHRYATEQMDRLNSEIRALRSELEQYRGKGGQAEDFSERLKSAQLQVAAQQGRKTGETPSPAER